MSSLLKDPTFRLLTCSTLTLESLLCELMNALVGHRDLRILLLFDLFISNAGMCCVDVVEFISEAYPLAKCASFFLPAGFRVGLGLIVVSVSLSRRCISGD